MEPAKIDWKNLEWSFVEDDLYEHINAPKWFDFLSPISPHHRDDDDEAWFCRPDCNHPKTAQDFLKQSTPPKLSEVSPFGNRTQRDMKLKRREVAQAWMSKISNSKVNQDSENQDPNQSTLTPINGLSQAKIFKASIKSSAEKKELTANEAAIPRLKSSLSARNLFAGRDILGQISEFCNELKRMAIRPRERENSDMKEEADKPKVEVSSEKKPLVKEKPQGCERGILKEKQLRVKKSGLKENIPVSVDLKCIKRKDENALLEIRINPPSPQCFSATRKPTPPAKSKLMERGIVQEQNSKQVVISKEEDKNKGVSMVESKEAKSLDVFWFLKPCTLSTYNNA